MARPTHAWLLAMLMAMRYACSDAWHQTFVPGREGTVRDVAIDELGVIGASMLAPLMRVKEA
jgi:VanZ family protein